MTTFENSGGGVHPSTLARPRPGNWLDPARVVPAGKLPWRTAIGLVTVGVGIAADAGVLTSSVQHVLRTSVPVSVMLSAVITLMATLVAYTAGYELRGAGRGTRTQLGSAVGGIALLVAWVVLGVMITILRLTAGAMVQVAAWDSTPATGTHKEWVPAAAFAALYLATGLIAGVDAFVSRNDAAKALRVARAQLVKTRRELVAAQALQVRLVENFAVRTRDMRALPAQHANALAANTALRRELEQLSRVEQAVVLGSPVMTGITSMAHPSNPMFQNAPEVSAAASKMTTDESAAR